jgi:hypothetical protein
MKCIAEALLKASLRPATMSAMRDPTCFRHDRAGREQLVEPLEERPFDVESLDVASITRSQPASFRSRPRDCPWSRRGAAGMEERGWFGA